MESETLQLWPGAIADDGQDSILVKTCFGQIEVLRMNRQRSPVLEQYGQVMPDAKQNEALKSRIRLHKPYSEG